MIIFTAIFGRVLTTLRLFDKIKTTKSMIRSARLLFMKNIRFLLFSGILAICFVSCTKDDFLLTNDQLLTDQTQLSRAYTDEAKQLLPFAKALYGAMKESPALRELIKNESLAQFNREYETLYQFIKDEKVENGLSVRELLLKHFNNAASLADIEALHPTLTIHIPILPEGSFSAESWNTTAQVPAVAIHPTIGLNPIIVSAKGQYAQNKDEFVLEPGYIPGFPVVVLKDNARVIVTQPADASKYPSLNNRNSDYLFAFIDDYFDGSLKESDYAPPFVDQKVIDAYTIYGTYGRQRDYIYYNLTPSNTTGTLDTDFTESVVGFKFSANLPQQIINFFHPFVATNEPQLPWTEGQYTFQLDVEDFLEVNPKVITRYFSAHPFNLFDISYTKSGNLYLPTFNSFNSIVLNIPLMTWDLEHYAEVLKISLWKINPNSTVTISGAPSNETYQISNVQMGDVLVDFGQAVITGMSNIDGNSTYELLDNNGGIFKLIVIPVKQH